MAYITNVLQAVYPKQQAINVSVTASPYLVFGTAMNKESLNAQTVYLTDAFQTVIPVTYTYQASSKTLTLNIDNPLSSESDYQIVVKGGSLGVKDILGNQSFQDYKFFFKTEKTSVIEPEEPNQPDEAEIPEEPEPENPSILDAPETPSGSGLFITTTYPENGELLLINSPIAIKFNLPIKEENLAEKISLFEKPISPLLELSNPYVSISLSLSESKDILRITPDTPLLEGTSYQLKIAPGIQSDIGETNLSETLFINFTTAYGRSYTNIRSIRLLAGLFAESFTDEDIALLISQESDGLYHRISRLTQFDETDWSDGKAPFGAEQYVRYSVVYQMALGQTLETSAGQRKNIQLADLKVDAASTVSSTVGGILDMLKAEIARWWDILINDETNEEGIRINKSIGSAVKAITNHPYADFMTRVPFNDLGG